MKKLISFLLLITPIMFINNASAATSGSCGDSATWSYDTTTKVLTISGTGNTYNYSTGTQPWGAYLGSIEEVVVSDGITRLGQFNFKNATKLTKVTLPESLTSLGGDVFNGASKLKDINFPSQLTHIPGWGFYGTALEEVTIPHASKIDNGAFDSSSLKKITLPEGLESINYRAFRLTNIEELVIPSSVKTIDSEAFSNVHSLKSLTIYDDEEITINSTAFWQVDMSKIKIYCAGKNGMGNADKCNSFFSKAGYNVSTISITDPLQNSKISSRIKRRIYTVQEANEAAGRKNTVMIRYK